MTEDQENKYSYQDCWNYALALPKKVEIKEVKNDIIALCRTVPENFWSNFSNKWLSVSDYSQICHNLNRHLKESYPLPYLTNQVYFYELSFYIEEGVFIPQPDTEVLVEKVLELANKYWEKQEKINNSGDKKLLDSFQKNGKTWKLTAKEKDLLFTLKVVLEMEMKGLKFARGLDFNNSEIKDFKIENNTIYFPFTAIAGIGEKLADKIITYRQEKGPITGNWKEELTNTLNINHLQQLENLEKHNLIINL